MTFCSPRRILYWLSQSLHILWCKNRRHNTYIVPCESRLNNDRYKNRTTAILLIPNALYANEYTKGAALRLNTEVNYSFKAKFKRQLILLEILLSGFSLSSLSLSSLRASSGMAVICTPGAWGSIRRFSNNLVLKWATCWEILSSEILYATR